MLQRALLWIHGQDHERRVRQRKKKDLLLTKVDALIDAHPEAAETLDSATQGASLFLDPTGTQVGHQVKGEEGIAYGDLDLSACIEPKQIHDVVGSYQRFDVFDFKVNRRRLGPSSASETEVNREVGELRSSPLEGSEVDVIDSRS